MDHAAKAAYAIAVAIFAQSFLLNGPTASSIGYFLFVYSVMCFIGGLFRISQLAWFRCLYAKIKQQ